MDINPHHCVTLVIVIYCMQYYILNWFILVSYPDPRADTGKKEREGGGGGGGLKRGGVWGRSPTKILCTL